MKVLTFSRQFPKGHPKAGQPTHFPEKIMAGLADRQVDFKIPDDFVLWEWLPYYNCRQPKHHTIRGGNRFKPGDMASLRVWSDKPYRSKQIEFAQVQIQKVFVIYSDGVLWWVNHQPAPTYILERIANNDGLSIQDFLNWFAIHPKKDGIGFYGQIISWSDKIDYTGKPASLEKEEAV